MLPHCIDVHTFVVPNEAADAEKSKTKEKKGDGFALHLREKKNHDPALKVLTS